MGMRLVRKIDFPSMKFSLYFLGNLTDEEVNKLQKIRMKEQHGHLNKKLC